LAERAYLATRDLIITLAIKPGSPIDEQALADKLHVGRTPIREAIKRLEFDQLVRVYPRRGTFVTDVNLTDLALITDVRMQLEGHAARRCAEQITMQERQIFQGLAREVRKANSNEAYLMELDSRVHRTVYSCAHNHYLEDSLVRYYNLSHRIWYVFRDRMPAFKSHIVSGHVTLIDAILNGDGERAAEIASNHVKDRADEQVRRALPG
jgi:DNA-binding GntR family transcriptional regulator